MKTIGTPSMSSADKLSVGELIIHEGNPAIVLEPRRDAIHSAVTIIVFPKGDTSSTFFTSVFLSAHIVSFGVDWVLETPTPLSSYRAVSSRRETETAIGDLVLTRDDGIAIVAKHSENQQPDGDRFLCFIEKGDFYYEEFAPLRALKWRLWISEDHRSAFGAEPFLEHDSSKP